MEGVYIGTSGWQYGHWKHYFYEGRPQREWLEYASARFSSIEVDGTFYRLPTRSSLENWSSRTPADFKFAIRGHRYTTHLKRLTDPVPTIYKQKEPAEGLGEKLAVVLWQLPPNFRKNVERLREFGEALRKAWPEVRRAIEFRHRTWFDDETARILCEFGIANTISDAGKWPRWDAVTADLVYVRLHGKPDTYVSGYDEADLREWQQKIEQWRDEGRQVHVYFDNDVQIRAPWDALRLMEMLGLTSLRHRAQLR